MFVCVSQGWIFDLGADGCTPMLLQGDQTVLVYIILKDKKKGEKVEFLKSIVSKNRLRYKDGDFNLDLSYITKRVIAMGYPGEGFYSLYRNDKSDVLNYFQKYHDSKVKIYNMCND